MRLQLHNDLNWVPRDAAERFARFAPLIAGTLVLLTGIYLGRPALVGVGLLSAMFALGRVMRRSTTLPPALPLPSLTSNSDVPAPASQVKGGPTELGMLIEEMLSHGRYALLLRPQIVGNLTPDQLGRTNVAFNDGMAIVPAGEVMLVEANDSQQEGRFSDDELERNRVARVQVEDYFLDRHLVTNRLYYQFVASGGYEQLSLWDPAILAAVLDFVDLTGTPGPRYWRDGRYPRGEEDYPVVGISWYEAAAFARWIGKRLPSDAEWVKAASWPVPVAANMWQQRKFPWGNAMERCRANLWGAGPGRTVPIDQYAEGVSAGGVHQLVGNVWEWTTGDFGYDDLDGPLHADPSGAAAMKTLRGGAFDTYFESQASCQFRSGDHPLARKHNIGFRCALSACDIFAHPSAEASASTEEIPYEENLSEAQLEEVAV